MMRRRRPAARLVAGIERHLPQLCGPLRTTSQIGDAYGITERTIERWCQLNMIEHLVLNMGGRTKRSNPGGSRIYLTTDAAVRDAIRKYGRY